MNNLALILALAHSTFYDALPANARNRPPIAPARLRPVKSANRGNVLHRAWKAVDNGFHRQRMKEREAYLAQSQDIFEVERRQRELERPRHR